MKLLYFHQHFSTPSGSTGIRSYMMARRLINAGHEVIMICGRYDGGKTGLKDRFVNGQRRGKVNGIEIIEFDLSYSNKDNYLKRSSTFMTYSIKCIGLLFKEEYELVFASSTPLTASIPGIFAKWFKKKPFVFEVRDLWPELPKSLGVIKNPIVLALMKLLEWVSYKSANHLIALSPGIMEGIVKRNIPPSKITLIPNGSDLEFYLDTSKGWKPAGINDDDLVAVFAGTHGYANGLMSIIETALELKRRNETRIKFILIGDGANKRNLMEIAKRNKLENIIFHPPVNKRKLFELFAFADLGMQILANNPSFYFGTSPNKFFDYIAAGLPVITNYPGWISELIDEYGCGFTVEPENPHAFADKLQEIFKKREQLAKMGKNSKLLAIQKFDRKKLSHKFLSVIEECKKKA